jgi:hypothetical protein
MCKWFLTAVVVLLNTTLFAQTVGRIGPTNNAFMPGARSLINLSHPAVKGGSLTSAQVIWSSGPAPDGCTAALKLQFFATEGSLASFRIVAERGPFDVKEGLNSYVLDPPVAISEGMMIGGTQLRAQCGGVGLSTTAPTLNLALFDGNHEVDDIVAPSAMRGYFMNIFASTTPESVSAIIPVVGSLAGSFGSRFKTSLQLTNLGGTAASTKLVFHPAGIAGTPSDPSRVIELAPQSVLSIDDVLETMGQSGIGSLDIMPLSGAPPFVSVHVFNDGGAAGTSGFSEAVFTPNDALQRSEMAVLPFPSDPLNFRMNVGVRTLSEGATVRFSVIRNSVQLQWLTRTYGANYFEQGSVTSLFNNTTFPSGSFLLVWVTAGSAIVYTSTTDNRTNDSRIEIATHR